MKKSKQPKDPQAEKKRLLKILTKKEKEVGMSDDTLNTEPLADIVAKAEAAEDEYEYWHWWTVFYCRVHWFFNTTNGFDHALEILGAPYYLRYEMEHNHDWSKPYGTGALTYYG